MCLSSLDHKNAVLDGFFIKKTANSLFLGIGDEHLTEVVVAYQLNDVINALVVEFIKNVIKKQDRLKAQGVACDIELGQLDGYYEGFLLALRTKFFQRVAFNFKQQIVFMDTCDGITQLTVALAIGH